MQDGRGTTRWTQQPNGVVTVVDLDGLGRPVRTITNYTNGLRDSADPAARDLITQMVYDAAGRRLRTMVRADPSDVVTAFTYDQRDQLTLVTENVASGACPLAPCNVQTQYTYDRAGNRTSIRDGRGQRRSFAYDAADQLITSADPVHPATHWQYDAGGRMTFQDDPRGAPYDLTFRYDEADRRTTTTASSLGTLSATYDALGRRTTLVDGTGMTTFTVDALGRLTQVHAPASGAVGYQYNARGDRTQLPQLNPPSLRFLR